MSFTRAQYEELFEFAREIYFWHESTGRGCFDTKAMHLMERIEDVIGQQSDFPSEARQRLLEDRRRNHPFKRPT